MHKSTLTLRKLEKFLRPALGYSLLASGSGPWPLAGLLLLKNFGQRFPVLKYHSVNSYKWNQDLVVSPELFDAQIAWLSKHYKVIDVSELFVLRMSLVRGRYICLTFDDGYQDFYSVAAPILEKYNAKATVYVTTDRISTAPERKNPQLAFLSEAEIKSLARRGFNIQSHGKTHRSKPGKPLNKKGFQPWYIREKFSLDPWEPAPKIIHPMYERVEDLERPLNETEEEFLKRATADLKESRRVISSLTKKSCNHLCWPRTRYSELSLKAAKEAGFLSTTAHCYANTWQTIDKVERLHVGDSDSIKRDLLNFKLKVLVATGNFYLVPALVLSDYFMKKAIKAQRASQDALVNANCQTL